MDFGRPTRKAIAPQRNFLKHHSIHLVISYGIGDSSSPPKFALLRGLGPAVILRGRQQRFTMTLDQATDLIKSCAEQMNARYKKVVFDEWAIISLAGRRGRVLTYSGPRKDGFQKNFRTDVAALREGLLDGKYTVGDFDLHTTDKVVALGMGVLLIGLLSARGFGRFHGGNSLGKP